MSEEDPRIYFASERTLLAWLRTGIAILGLGFLVARFGLFLTVLTHTQVTHPTLTGPTVIGTGFVLIGALVMAFAAVQHVRFSQSLTPLQRPSRYWTSFSVIVTLCLAVLSALLGVYLVISMMQ